MPPKYKEQDGKIYTEDGTLVQGGFDVAKGIMPSTRNASGEYLLGVNPDGSLRFGGLSGGSSTAPGVTINGVTASTPAVNAEDIRKQTESQFSGQRRSLEEQFKGKIGQVQGLGQEEQRATSSALGMGRRFSTSGQAFLKFLDEKNKESIANLEVQRDSALADFDFKLASLIDQRIQNERNAQQQEFQNALALIDRAQKTEKPSATLTPQGEKDATILKAIDALGKEGDTEFDIGKIFTTANSIAPDISLDDVTKALTSLGKTLGIRDGVAEKLTGDAKNFFLLKENYPKSLPASVTSLPEEEQLGAYLKWVEQSSKTAKTGGSGGIPGMGGFEGDALGIRVARAMFGTGRALSDKDVEIGSKLAAQGAKEGLSELEILKKGLGYNIDRNPVLADNLFNMLVANSEDGMANLDLLGLAKLINGGKDQLAIQKAEDMAYQAAKKIDPNTFLSEAAVKTTTQQVNELLDLLDNEKFSQEVGTYNGTITNLITRRFRGKEATEIKNRVENLVANMRKNLAGVAVTPSEMARLEPLFPDIDQPASSFMVELRNLKTIPLLNLNQIRADRNMPMIDEKQLFNRDLRVGLYQGAKNLSDDDFFNNPLPSDAGGQYSPSVWDSAP